MLCVALKRRFQAEFLSHMKTINASFLDINKQKSVRAEGGFVFLSEFLVDAWLASNPLAQQWLKVHFSHWCWMIQKSADPTNWIAFPPKFLLQRPGHTTSVSGKFSALKRINSFLDSPRMELQFETSVFLTIDTSGRPSQVGDDQERRRRAGQRLLQARVAGVQLAGVRVQGNASAAVDASVLMKSWSIKSAFSALFLTNNELLKEPCQI